MFSRPSWVKLKSLEMVSMTALRNDHANRIVIGNVASLILMVFVLVMSKSLVLVLLTG